MPTATATPTPMPKLTISAGKFVANGQEVVLRGATFPHFSYQQSTDKPSYYFAVFKRDIDTLKEMGANFANIQWNSGFLDNPTYVENLAAGLEYAKSKGFWVELSLHSRGRDPTNTWRSNGLNIADDQIIDDWSKLLSDSKVTKRIANSVDIFGVIAELEKNSRGEYVKWNEAADLEKRAVLLIRQKTNNERAIGAFTGPGFAGDARGAVNAPPDIDNIAIELHPYQWIDKIANFKASSAALKAKGVLVFVGEMGHDDPLSFVEDQYEFLVENGMSFAVYAIISDSDYGNAIVNKFGITERGKLAEKYFRSGQ